MPKPALVQSSLPAVHVLLVEDNPSDAFVVGNLLGESTQTAFTPCHVRSQSEAVATLARQSFDVCLLDLTLPDASGFSALIDIQEKAPDMPVLILTGTRDATLAKRTVGRGAQDYLLKDELELARLSRAIDYAMERKHVEKGLFQRANFDTLTGLANRDMFTSRLHMAMARADRSGGNIAVLFIDLDGFKPINDTHGHDAGDEVLKTVAQRIRSALRAYDTPARFGGDEFAVLLEGIPSPRNAANIARKIIKTLSTPIPYHAHYLDVGVSIGIAFSDAQVTPEVLLQHADVAMYHAKDDGGGTYRFYAADMHDEAAARLTLEEDLRTALAMGELRLHYQPWVNPEGEAVLGVEALLRWLHPERGILNAHEFLPAAEEARLMPEIGQWMCSQVRHDIAVWNAHALPPLCVAVNLSVSQLDAPDLLQWLLPIAQEDFLGHHRLAVEVPEAAVAPISGTRFMTLAKIYEMGIELHLDHFGCSVLPMTTLCSLPFSLLKLDRSLVDSMSDNIEENVLISAAIMLAHHLGIKAGAVGVETQQQAQALRAHACDVVQGFLTVPPMTVEQLVGWMEIRP